MPRSRRQPQEAPPGYPRSYEIVARLADGRRVTIRPILPSDAPELAEAILTADADTLRGRFMGAPPPLTQATLDGLTRLDYAQRFALVARSAEGHGIGVARYSVLPSADDSPVSAEVAVAVAPEWRRVGLATTLLQLLARRALECGITHFSALFLAENRPVTELAQLGHARVVIAQGAAQLEASLTTPGDDSPGNGRPGKERSPGPTMRK